MALRSVAVKKPDPSTLESQAFSPANLRDALEIRTARDLMRSRRKMLDLRNTSITFLPLSDSEQLTLRNRLDFRSKQDQQISIGNNVERESTRKEEQNPVTALKSNEIDLFDRSQIDKIFKIIEVVEKDKVTEVKEEIRLRPGRKLAPGKYELSFITPPTNTNSNPDEYLLRIQIPEGCQKKAKALFVNLAGLSDQFGYVLEGVQSGALSDKSKKQHVIVTLQGEKRSNTQLTDCDFSDQQQQIAEQPVVVEEAHYKSRLVKLISELTNATNDPRDWIWKGA